jgi:hypothetical protein
VLPGLVIKHVEEIGTSVADVVHIVTGAGGSNNEPETRETRNQADWNTLFIHDEITVEKFDTVIIMEAKTKEKRKIKFKYMTQKIELTQKNESLLQSNISTTKHSSPLS